jgi:diguanylate cyclase
MKFAFNRNRRKQRKNIEPKPNQNSMADFGSELIDQRLSNEVIQNINQGIAITDSRGRVIKVNKRFMEMTGYSEEELIGVNFTKINQFNYPKEFFKNIIRVIQEKGKWQGEVLHRRRDGKVIPEYLTIYPVKNEQGKVIHFFGFFIDLKDIKEKEKALWEAKSQFQTIVEYSPLGIIVCNSQGIIKLWNWQAEKILGYDRSLVLEHHIQHFIPDFSDLLPSDEYDKDFDSKQMEIKTTSQDGKKKILQISCAPIRKQNNKLNGFQILFNDMTEYKEAQWHIEYLKNHDENTGLYNFDYFYTYITNCLKGNPDQKFTMLLMDIDRFEQINNKFGTRFGDKIIEEAGRKIKEAVGNDGIVSKLKGDEFGCFIRNIQQEDEVIELARKIFANLYEPLIVEGQPVHITLSMGISIYPNDGQSFEQLSKSVNLALSRAKVERNVFKLYDQTMHDDSNHFYYENELHKALKESKLTVHYQPQIDFSTNEVYGVEALLRWYHPVEGNIPPSLFIPLAEDSGLIVSLTEYMIHRVCQDYLNWCREGVKLPALSINLSAKQFFKNDFVDDLIDILNIYNIPKDILHIEITESVAMDIKNSLDNFKKLKEHGIKISIDDFGTGYSSLKYLQELPIDFVKIDKSFVSMITDGNTSMVDFIIHIASVSGMKVVGEGVETEEQNVYLKSHGCTIGQGYYYSEPINSVELMDKLKKRVTSN